ncbi:hypothetical protein SUDANB150_01645 [Streptomyces sp. enrichment culture]
MFERRPNGAADRELAEEVSTMAVTVTGAARIQESIESTSAAAG